MPIPVRRWDSAEKEAESVDKKIKVWSTLPILDPDAQENDANHKLLCTMSAHTGESSAERHICRVTLDIRLGSCGQVGTPWPVSGEWIGRPGGDDMGH